MKYKLQWPILIEDCYECGRGIHFQKPWRRAHKQTPLLSGAMEMILDSARLVSEYKSSPVFSKESVLHINSGKVTVPRVVNNSEPFGPKVDDVTQQFEWTYDATDTV